MPAPKGNQFWKMRSRHGRQPIYTSAEMFWEACEDYFEWVEDNPLLEAKMNSYQGQTEIVPLPKMRAMTIDGLLTFVDISRPTWDLYKTKEGFSDVITRVERIMRDQKFSGAAAELLNPQIIARDLGLRDKQDLDVSGHLDTLSDEDLDRRIAQLLGKG